MPNEMILLTLILLAGFYMAWSIGANDVANAMGTSVGSGALTLKKAVIIAAVLEFSGAFFFGSPVAETLQSGIVNSEIFSTTPMLFVYGMLSALIATGAWLQMASYCGWPVSTTHAIVGGVVGFGAVIGGFEAVYWGNVSFIAFSWVLSPILGGVLSYIIFNFLRKQILYAVNPVAQAKKLAPFFVFIVLTTLSLILVYNGLKNLGYHPEVHETIGLSILIGIAGAVISYFYVQTFKETPATIMPTAYRPEIVSGLDKAWRQLKQVQGSSSGEVQYQVSVLQEEIKKLSQSLKQTTEVRASSSEYAVVEKIFGSLQIMSACMMAFAHGANDVANAIGPLSAAINVLKTGQIQAYTAVPVWALALGGFGIVVGLATWGWRVIETIGKKITELTPTRGFAAEFGAAATVLIASRLGLPVSTTHTLVGSVIGVGLARGIEALNLSTMRDIVASWVITLPVSAILTVGLYYIIHAIFG